MFEPVGFTEAWRAQFPESEPPCMDLNSQGDIEQELNKCKSSIRHLEKEVNKERFRMIYLQTILAKERKSYDGQRWGFRKAPQANAGDPPMCPESSQALGEEMARSTQLPEDEADCVPPSNTQRCDTDCVSPPPQETPDIPVGVGTVAALRCNFERIKRADSQCADRAFYVNMEYHQQKGLVRVNDRDVSDRISALGCQAMQMERKRSLPSFPGHLSAAAADAGRSVLRGRSVEDGCGFGSYDDLTARSGGGGTPECVQPYTSVYVGGLMADRVARVEDDRRLTWPRRSYSPGSCEDVAGGYTPDGSSNENLTSSEEDFSSGPSSHVSPSPTSCPVSRGESRSPSQRSLESGSPPTPLALKRLQQQALASQALAAHGRRPPRTGDTPPSSSKHCRPTRRSTPGPTVELDQEKGLEMRKWVLSGILASEEAYLGHLEALLIPMKPLRAAATTSQPMLSTQQIETIFFKVPELHQIHKDFYDALLPRVQDWSSQRCVGDLFQRLANQLGVYRAFVDNYKVAVETADKCCQANVQFAEISEVCVLPRSQGALLYKPVDRVTRSTLVLHDLLKHTPACHPDHALLQDALRISHNFLSSINEEITPRRQSMTVKKGENRQLLRDRFMVELVEGSRKLRHVFLFTDLLLCTKLKKQPAGKAQQYECKWYIPLADLAFHTIDDAESTTIPLVQDEEIDAMKFRISQIKNDIQREKRSAKGLKLLERLRKKLAEQESLLLLTSPNMAFRVANRNGKGFTFLISSDYERAEWRELVHQQQKKCHKSFSLTSLELQMLTNSCVKLQMVHSVPVIMSKEDEESSGLYGFLNVIVHSASGFKHTSINLLYLYCTLEVDAFGYFVNKAKTRVYRDSTEPCWNEEFEIELEGSQTLRLLCYEKCCGRTRQSRDEGENTERIVAKGQITLDPQTLQNKDWQRTVITMNGVEVKLSMKFTSREFSLKRMPSRKQSGVFGVKINVVTKRERSKVPLIVRQCVEEIEMRGMEEVGIYRVSGVATDIQGLKAAFDSNNKDVSVVMREMDVNAIAGTLKLYFRELPEPLFTDDLYPSFSGGLALSDSVAKESCMLHLLLSLPEANLVTFLFLLDHLKRVAENEGVNKMSSYNLATVFGPTLLRPSEKDSRAGSSQPLSMNDSWSLEVMSQVQLLLYFLQLENIPAPDSKRQSLLFSSEI
uniref:Uncharacterized protein n=1 Tax=Gadus morhua TaxID=8049 RepID=A0A8C5BTH2_GADMO